MRALPRPAARFVPGIVCLPFGIAVGVWVAYGAIGDGWEYFPLYAGLAAFIAPTLCWWWLIERKGRRTPGRAALAGALGAALGHHLCWYFMLLAENVRYWILGGGGSSLGEPPLDPLTGLVGVLGHTAFSYLVIGWLTIPAGALLGLVCHHLLRRHQPAVV